MKPSHAGVSPGSGWSGIKALIVAVAVAAATSALLAAGCGGGASGAKVAQVETTQTTTTESSVTGRSRGDALVAFSVCMRKNGVPKFPDPEAVDGGMRLSFGSENGIHPNAPQFKRAQRACQKLLPNGGKSSAQEQARHLQEALDFARCIREHGVPTFPDPKASGDGGIEWEGGDIMASAQFEAADQACRKLVPGAPPGSGPGERP
jgi:hypothetical protein